MQELQRDNDARWEQVRARYPAQEPLLNLNNAAVSPPPRVVEQARSSRRIGVLDTAARSAESPLDNGSKPPREHPNAAPPCARATLSFR